MSLAPTRPATAAIIAFFLIFFLSRIITVGFPELETSASEQIESNSVALGGWPQLIEESGLLPELQQSRVLVPPDRFAWMTAVLGIGTTTTWKRFYQPADEWFSEILLFCDAEFRVSDVEQLRALREDVFDIQDVVQRCYESLSWKQLEEIARDKDAQFAIVPIANGNGDQVALFSDSKWGLIRVENPKASRNQ